MADCLRTVLVRVLPARGSDVSNSGAAADQDIGDKAAPGVLPTMNPEVPCGTVLGSHASFRETLWNACANCNRHLCNRVQHV